MTLPTDDTVDDLMLEMKRYSVDEEGSFGGRGTVPRPLNSRAEKHAGVRQVTSASSPPSHVSLPPSCEVTHHIASACMRYCHSNSQQAMPSISRFASIRALRLSGRVR